MCGICGAVRLRSGAAPPDLEELRRIRAAMAKRGPDGEGEWSELDAGVALGHRRLAVLDLSSAAAQPMSSRDGNLRIAFNGAIYNFRELRAELVRQGVELRTASDTEVILALWEREGSASLGRLRGMFAIAIWDRARRSLSLARDPFGIKPLYYGHQDGIFRFASQVRALEAGGTVSRQLEPAAVVGFLLWGSVPEPWTIRRGIVALPAGAWLEVRDGRIGEPKRFSSGEEAAEMQAPTLDAVSAVRESVRAHLVSDVPVALFLSAGLDSALVAAIAARELGDALTTFTLSFEAWRGTERDEGPSARRVAEALGARHVERSFGRDEIAAAWPRVLAVMDQPSIDGFNSYLVAQVAHESGFRVALSGLGGDELFGGYPSFRDVPAWHRGARLLAKLPGLDACWPALARLAAPSRPKLGGLLRYGRSIAGSYYLRRGLFLPEQIAALVGHELAAEGLRAYDAVADAERTLRESALPGSSPGSADEWVRVQRLEASHYLRNQLLRDTDWAGMASSVEVRVPLLDLPLWRNLAHAGFEPARSRGKAELVRRIVPGLAPEIWNRPKSGFGVPSEGWLSNLPRDVRGGRIGKRGRAGQLSRQLAVTILQELGA